MLVMVGKIQKNRRKSVMNRYEGRQRDLSLAQASRFLQVSQSTLRRWTREGLVRAYRIGRKWRYPVRELEALKRSGPVDLRKHLESLLQKLNLEARDIAEKSPGDMDNPASRLALSLIAHSMLLGASDIHIEPQPSKSRIRHRVDGVLHPVAELELSVARLLVGAIKQLVRLEPSESLLPQYGTAELRLASQELQLNVTTLPTPYGEGVTVRLFPKESARRRVERLGLLEDDYQRFLSLINSPNGLILISSPEGHGRTTTAYCILNYHCRPDRAIISIENPIEFELSDIIQTQLEPESGYTAEVALRAALRSAPNIIFLSDLNDARAGGELCRAAASGQLVIASLTANSAIDAIFRVLELGVSARSFIPVLCGSVNQRLVRRICEKCKEEYPPSLDDIRVFEQYGLEGPDSLFRGRGCKECLKTGYRGRTALFEILEGNPGMSELLQKATPREELEALARQQGFRPLLVDGFLKALRGITTLDEVLLHTVNSDREDLPYERQG